MTKFQRYVRIDASGQRRRNRNKYETNRTLLEHRLETEQSLPPKVNPDAMPYWPGELRRHLKTGSGSAAPQELSETRDHHHFTEPTSDENIAETKPLASEKHDENAPKVPADPLAEKPRKASNARRNGRRKGDRRHSNASSEGSGPSEILLVTTTVMMDR